MHRLAILLALLLVWGCSSTQDPDKDEDTAATTNTDTASSDTQSSGGDLQWYTTCGDPVCSGHTADPNVPNTCTSETEGAACSEEGALCDPVNDCNAKLMCASSDPKDTAEGCPRSRRSLKSNIRYLSPAQKHTLARQLREMPLAYFRYLHTPQRDRLGFIIEDIEPSFAVDPERDMVDLYGYLSMSIAAYQAQAAELDALRAEVAAMREELRALRTASGD